MALVPTTGLYGAAIGAFLANIHNPYTLSAVYAPGKALSRFEHLMICCELFSLLVIFLSFL